MPKKRMRNKPNSTENHLNELRALFDSDDDDEVDFPGFDILENINFCLLYTSPSPRDTERSRMPSSA